MLNVVHKHPIGMIAAQALVIILHSPLFVLGGSPESLHFTGQRWSKYFSKISKCAFFACDFNILVKSDITEDSQDSAIHCVLRKNMFVFVCGWFEISIIVPYVKSDLS